MHHQGLEKEELTAAADKQKEDLLAELATLQRDRDDALLIAENDKQQVKLLKVTCFLGIFPEICGQ